MNFKRFYKLYTENAEEQKLVLSPKIIYNFYYIWYLYVHGEIKGEYSQFILSEFLKSTKNIYLMKFSLLVKQQIEKYIKRGRVDSDVTLDELNKQASNPVGLHSLMQKTYRSDMQRRNDVWNLIGEYLVKLSNASTPKDMFLYIDRLNNCVHNVPESVLAKFENSDALLTALNKTASATDINHYKMYVNKDIQEIRNNA